MKQVITEEQCLQLVYEQYCKQERFKQQEAQFKKDKSEFELAMTEYMGAVGKKKLTFDVSGFTNAPSQLLTITMVEKTKIVWFAEKLKKRITKPIAKQVFKKQYQIVDMKGLAKYLKECGVNPKVFARYLSVTEEVDSAAIDRLSELGKITPKNISGCYIVQCSAPYFKLSMKKEKSSDGEWEE